jgi:hypothetical protein
MKLGRCIAHHLPWEACLDYCAYVCGKGCKITYQEALDLQLIKPSGDKPQ